MESISHNYEKYLQSGKKTTLSNKRKNFFKEKFKDNDNLLNTIYTRKQEYFDQETHSKGNNIGKVDVNQILEADKNET